MSGYCAAAPGHEWHGPYHDTEYGFPARDEAVLFERLVLEINQAGLSWLTILKKRAAFRLAYEGFRPATVAAYGPADRARLLADAGIIRNRLKVDAAIENARRILKIRDSHGGLAAWLDAHHPRPKADWVKLFKQTFVFTGGEITGEFLMSLGYLPGAHASDCPVATEIAALGPPLDATLKRLAPKRQVNQPTEPPATRITHLLDLARQCRSMRVAVCMVSLILLPALAEARPAVVSPANCRLLAAHVASADTAYQPGVDVRGRPVAPADLAGSPRMRLPDHIVVPITVELDDRLGIPPAGDAAFTAEARIGTVVVDSQGHAALDGQPLTDAQTLRLRAACAEAPGPPSTGQP